MSARGSVKLRARIKELEAERDRVTSDLDTGRQLVTMTFARSRELEAEVAKLKADRLERCRHCLACCP